MTMPAVQLGNNGPSVGAQGLGCMLMQDFDDPADVREARAVLESALEAGVTLFDTADMYGAGTNEEFLAPFFAANRDEVTIASKFGIVYDGSPGRSVRGDRSYVRASAEASLRRLKLVAEGKVKHLGLSEVTAPELRAAAGVHPITAVQSEWSLITRDIEARVVPAAAVLGTAFVPYAPLGRGSWRGCSPTRPTWVLTITASAIHG